MNAFFAELYAALVPGLVAPFGTLLTIILARAAKVAQERWGIEVETGHRDALHSAVMSGLMAALARGLTPQAAVDAAIDHVETSVPDALRRLSPAPGVLRAIVEGKLQVATGGAAAR